MPHRRHAPIALVLLSLALAACQVPTSGDEVPRLTVEELQALLDAGEGVVIADSRTARAYDRRHIPGAISMPVREVAHRHGELPHDATIVFY